MILVHGFQAVRRRQRDSGELHFAENAITQRASKINGPLKQYIEDKFQAMEDALGQGHADDPDIVEKWRELDAARRIYLIKFQRIEDFVAAGLIWLAGDPWDQNHENFVFADYPTLRFRAASNIAIAAYNHLTDRKPA